MRNHAWVAAGLSASLVLSPVTLAQQVRDQGGFIITRSDIGSWEGIDQHSVSMENLVVYKGAIPFPDIETKIKGNCAQNYPTSIGAGNFDIQLQRFDNYTHLLATFNCFSKKEHQT